MADLTGIQAGQTVKIVGNDATGTETNPVGADASGHMHVIDVSTGTNGGPVTPKSSLIAGKETASGNMIPIQVDIEGRLVTSAITGFGANFSFGDVTTAVIARVPVRRTTYTEPTANAQRSISSSSALDTAIGTGARTVKLTYCTITGTGPFTEIITLNGIIPVNTVATNIGLIEKIEVMTAGSTGSNVGILTLFVLAAGLGGVIGTISATNNQTFWAHHYIPVGKIANITGISCGHSGTTVGSGGVFTINTRPVGVTDAIEQQSSDFIRLYGQSSTFSRNYVSPLKIAGPARLVVYVTPESSTSVIYRAAIDYFEP